jgi:hypothetical protein
MFELLLASSLVAGLVFAITRRSGRVSLRSVGDLRTALPLRRPAPVPVAISAATSESSRRVIAADLPCPWCEAATAETDAVCPSCGQRFG